MDYNEFLEEIVRQVKKNVEVGTRVLITHALKNNQNKICNLSILKEGENLSPAINMNEYYSEYRKGRPMEEIVRQILRVYDSNRTAGYFDISNYTDFNKVKNKIVCKLVSYKKNEYILSQVPHVRFLDLAVVYYYLVNDQILGKGSILVQNSHMELWDLTPQMLYDLAYNNTLRLLPYEFWGIDELLAKITGVPLKYEPCDTGILYVLTNTEQYYGAVTMIFESVLEEIYQKLGCEYYVLPSSIHECMVIETKSFMGLSELQMMVKDINRENVPEGEVLGESIYKYNKDSKRLEIVCD